MDSIQSLILMHKVMVEEKISETEFNRRPVKNKKIHDKAQLMCKKV